MRFVFLSLIMLSGCTNQPKEYEFKNAVGVYKLTKYTRDDLYSDLKDKNVKLFVYEDLTFEIKADKKYCFTNVKGHWSIDHDLENTLYVLELNGKKKSSPWMKVWIDCDSVNGILDFEGIRDKSPLP